MNMKAYSPNVGDIVKIVERKLKGIYPSGFDGLEAKVESGNLSDGGRVQCRTFKYGGLNWFDPKELVLIKKSELSPNSIKQHLGIMISESTDEQRTKVLLEVLNSCF